LLQWRLFGRQSDEVKHSFARDSVWDRHLFASGLLQVGLLDAASEKKLEWMLDVSSQFVLRSPTCRAEIVKNGRISQFSREMRNGYSVHLRLRGGAERIRTFGTTHFAASG
jgi:hypothetical protein